VIPSTARETVVWWYRALLGRQSSGDTEHC